MPVDPQIDHRPVIDVGDMQTGGMLVAGLAAGFQPGFEPAHQPFGERLARRCGKRRDHARRHFGRGQQIAERDAGRAFREGRERQRFACRNASAVLP